MKRGADKAATDAIDRHVQTERDGSAEDDEAIGGLAPAGANGPAASGARQASKDQEPTHRLTTS
jgi:hypothetical protein